MCACFAGYHREKEGGVKKLYATTQFAVWGRTKEGENRKRGRIITFKAAGRSHVRKKPDGKNLPQMIAKK